MIDDTLIARISLMAPVRKRMHSIQSDHVFSRLARLLAVADLKLSVVLPTFPNDSVINSSPQTTSKSPHSYLRRISKTNEPLMLFVKFEPRQC